MQNLKLGVIVHVQHRDGRIDIVPDVDDVCYWDGDPPQRAHVSLIRRDGREIKLDRRRISVAFLVSPATGKTVGRINALAPDVEPA